MKDGTACCGRLAHQLRLLISVSVLLAGCGTPLASLSSLAAAGRIDSGAPVKATVQVAISAAPAVVWAELVNVQNWPSWNSQVRHVDTTGPLHQGMSFTWNTDGTNISSQVQLCEPNHRLAWTGTALSAKAIHVWELNPGRNGQTIVRVQESMEGPLLARFISSTELADADRRWLYALKAAAEQH